MRSLLTNTIFLLVVGAIVYYFGIRLSKKRGDGKQSGPETTGEGGEAEASAPPAQRQAAPLAPSPVHESLFDPPGGALAQPVLVWTFADVPEEVFEALFDDRAALDEYLREWSRGDMLVLLPWDMSAGGGGEYSYGAVADQLLDRLTAGAVGSPWQALGELYYLGAAYTAFECNFDVGVGGSQFSHAPGSCPCAHCARYGSPALPVPAEFMRDPEREPVPVGAADPR